MSNPISQPPDYAPMIDAARQGVMQFLTQWATPYMDGAVQAMRDAATVTALDVMLVTAAVLIGLGVRSRRLHVFLMCAAVSGVLAVLSSQLLSAVPFTWASVGLGFLLFMLIASVILGGAQLIIRGPSHT